MSRALNRQLAFMSRMRTEQERQQISASKKRKLISAEELAHYEKVERLIKAARYESVNAQGEPMYPGSETPITREQANRMETLGGNTAMEGVVEGYTPSSSSSSQYPTTEAKSKKHPQAPLPTPIESYEAQMELESRVTDQELADYIAVRESIKKNPSSSRGVGKKTKGGAKSGPDVSSAAQNASSAWLQAVSDVASSGGPMELDDPSGGAQYPGGAGGAIAGGPGGPSGASGPSAGGPGPGRGQQPLTPVAPGHWQHGIEDIESPIAGAGVGTLASELGNTYVSPSFGALPNSDTSSATLAAMTVESKAAAKAIAVSTSLSNVGYPPASSSSSVVREGGEAAAAAAAAIDTSGVGTGAGKPAIAVVPGSLNQPVMGPPVSASGGGKGKEEEKGEERGYDEELLGEGGGGGNAFDREEREKSREEEYQEMLQMMQEREKNQMAPAPLGGGESSSSTASASHPAAIQAPSAGSMVGFTSAHPMASGLLAAQGSIPSAGYGYSTPKEYTKTSLGEGASSFEEAASKGPPQTYLEAIAPKGVSGLAKVIQSQQAKNAMKPPTFGGESAPPSRVNWAAAASNPEAFEPDGKYASKTAALVPGQQPFINMQESDVLRTQALPASDPMATQYRAEASRKRKVLKEMVKDQVSATKLAPGTFTAGEAANPHTAQLQTISSGATTAGDSAFAYGGPYDYPTEVGNPAFMRLIHGYHKLKNGKAAGSSLWKTTHTKSGKVTERKKYYKFSARRKKWRKVTRDYKSKWVKNGKKHEGDGKSAWPGHLRHKTLEQLAQMYGKNRK